MPALLCTSPLSQKVAFSRNGSQEQLITLAIFEIIAMENRGTPGWLMHALLCVQLSPGAPGQPGFGGASSGPLLFHAEGL